MFRSLDPSLSRLAVTLIVGYQRYLSPRKGFSCAHRVRHGGDSCSEHARKVFAQEGWRLGLNRLALRFRACQAANQAHKDDEFDRPGNGKTTKTARGWFTAGDAVECCAMCGVEGCCSAATHASTSQ